jgi:heat shock protein HslJ
LKEKKTPMNAKLSGPLAAAGLVLSLAACSLNGGAALPAAPSTDGSSAAAAATLPGGTWRLVSLRETGQPEVAVARPDLFTAEFTAGGRIELRADCNRCAGSYTSGAASLSVTPMACTRAYCVATAPLDSTFTKLAGEATTWTAGDERLELASDSGILRFQR